MTPEEAKMVKAYDDSVARARDILQHRTADVLMASRNPDLKREHPYAAALLASVLAAHIAGRLMGEICGTGVLDDTED